MNTQETLIIERLEDIENYTGKQLSIRKVYEIPLTYSLRSRNEYQEWIPNPAIDDVISESFFYQPNKVKKFNEKLKEHKIPIKFKPYYSNSKVTITDRRAMANNWRSYYSNNEALYDKDILSIIISRTAPSKIQV